MTKDQQIRNGRFCICCGNLLGPKRQIRKGGSGICATCDPTAPPRTEHICREHLLKLVPFVPETVDNAMFGKDCSVDKQRRPDLLWIVRSPDDGRITGAIKVGIDEDSHTARAGKSHEEHSACEVGRVGNQHEALIQLIHREDVLRLENAGSSLSVRMLEKRAMRVPERDAISKRIALRLVPCYFLKFNPDSYDGGTSSMEERIVVLATRINGLHTEIQNSYKVKSVRPFVEFFFFHSKAKYIIDSFRSSSGCVVSDSTSGGGAFGAGAEGAP